jgi:hypothetical protein
MRRPRQPGDARADRQQQHDAVARHGAPEEQIGGDHAERQQRLRTGCLEGAHTERQEDAGHHAAGNAARHADHDPFERTGEADPQKDDGRGQVGADRFGEGQPRKQRDQERGAGSGPRGDDRGAQRPAQDDPGDARADRDAPDPRGEHGVRHTACLCGLDKDGKRSGERHQHGEKARGDGGRRPVGPAARALGRPQGIAVRLYGLMHVVSIVIVVMAE